MSRLRRPWVKICGLAAAPDVRSCYELGANAVGFIVVPNTHPNRNKDQLLLEEAATLIQLNTTPLHSVILTHSKDCREILNISAVAKPSYIQLQSDVKDLRGFSEHLSDDNLKFIKKVGVDADKSVDDLKKMVSDYQADGCYSMFFLDTASVSGGKGGTGKVHDWNLSAQLIRSFPELKFVLAGGLGPMNVKSALELVRPWGVDVMTGVSSERGVKDLPKIAQFISAVNEFSLGADKPLG